MQDVVYRTMLATMGAATVGLRLQKPTIFCFHSVTPENGASHSPMAVSAGFIASLARHFRQADIPVLGLPEALARIRDQDDRPFVVLSFDDGYRDNYDNLFPVMQKLQLPFTIFVTTGLVDREIPMWWDALERLSQATSAKRAGVDKRPPIAALSDAFKASCPSGQRLLMHDLARSFSAVQVDRAYEMALTWPMLREMHASGLLTVGVHTRHHPVLARLHHDQIEAEFSHARHRLEEELDAEIPYLAYPFGQAHEVGPLGYAIARRSGFDAAFTTEARPLNGRDGDQMLRLPRILLSSKAQRNAIASAYTSGMPALFRKIGRAARPDHRC